MLLTLGAATSCSQDKEDPTPTTTDGSILKAQLVQKWQLDEIYLNGTLSASGTSIKDRYIIQFKADDTYTQTLLSDGTAFKGTWKLEPGTATVLHLTDHKGDAQDYVIGASSVRELRYARVNKEGKTEELRFSSTL
ncbi:hypothetical protein KLP40_10550 [Hymenobacter sp. NST-14]|uniref:hypothetical protein n=1 Tax=Hymenobacter piscis TaxID=2839984 RepID=UPI001C01B6DE|nr:hypothetical protein [Hymenobacter piscis]MBT9393601.1 hypothetical protein [Hymenobacter piscis]